MYRYISFSKQSYTTHNIRQNMLQISAWKPSSGLQLEH